MYHLTDIGALVAFQPGAHLLITAGAGQDGVQQNTTRWIDRSIPLGRETSTTPPGTTGVPSFSPRAEGPYDSAVLLIFWEAVLAQGATLTLALAALTAADASGTGAAVYSSMAAAVVATGPTGGGTVRGVTRLNLRLDMAAAGPFVREQYTADLSAANTDTVHLTPAWCFGGSDLIPVA